MTVFVSLYFGKCGVKDWARLYFIIIYETKTYFKCLHVCFDYRKFTDVL